MRIHSIHSGIALFFLPALLPTARPGFNFRVLLAAVVTYHGCAGRSRFAASARCLSNGAYDGYADDGFFH
jgi:hypothetical protein